MVVFAKEIIVPTNFNLNPTVPSHNRRLRQIFKGAVSALDGTLIHAYVPINKQHLYRGREMVIAIINNVLAICDFNMMFNFFVDGWEGVAHDSRILSEAIRNQNAPFSLPPSDKYYLCDAAYAHTRGFMAPYRNRMTPFSLTTQRNITIACFALHNFIRKEGLDDELFSKYDQSNVQLDNENLLVEDDGDGGGWDDGGRRLDEGCRRLDGSCRRLRWWPPADEVVVAAAEMRWWWELRVTGFVLKEKRRI
nr:hypothetical protein [Tanacetum cinerariifolium]